MRGLLLAGAMCAGLLLAAQPAHSQESQAEAQERALLDRVGRWKIINTAIFVALLGWYLAKKGPAFFQTRSADIQKTIQEATGLKLEADYRYSEIDRKMANLAGEVKKIREQAEAEMEREHGRMKHETELEISRIRHNAVNEIEALRQEAANHVQYRTAQLALEQAERQLQDRLSRGEAGELTDDFIRLVERGNN